MSTGTRVRGSGRWRGSWRVALRLARRETARGKGRTALVVAMVGIPVMLVVALSTLFHTNDISPREGLAATLGQAQAMIQLDGDTRYPVTQGPSATGWSSSGESTTSKPWTTAELSQVTGSRLVPLTRAVARLSNGAVALPVESREFPTADPATRGLVTMTAGRLPRASDEIAITSGLSDLGWPVGTQLKDLDSGTTKTVVGVYTSLGMSGDVRQALGVPGSLHEAGADDPSTATYLLVRDRPVSWAEVQRLNRQGLVVTSRQVIVHPPSTGSLTDQQKDMQVGNQSATRALLVIVTVSIVIEVILLAGPAFAVGVRRRRRDLALLAATGSTPRDIRRGVLAQAGLVGAGAAVLGALLGLPLAIFAIPVAEHFGAAFGPFDWRPSELLITLLIGAAAAVIAALVPALQASRADIATVLAGRRGSVSSRAGWPLIGLALIGGGTAVALVRGTRPGGEYWVAGGTIVIVLGAVGATPWLIGLVGRLATRLPLALRLATRDAARQRARTAPAVAAIMASVIGITALAIGFASDNKQSRRDYEPRSAPGVATVSLPDSTTSSERTIAAAINDALPNRPLFTSFIVGGSTDPNPRPSDRIIRPTLVPPGCTAKQSDSMSDTSAADAPSEHDQQCVTAWNGVQTSSGEFVALDPAALPAYGVHLDAQATTVLTSGGVLVARSTALRGDRALVGILSARSDATGGTTVTRQVSLPAAVLPSLARTSQIALAVLTPATAKRLGLSLAPTQIAIGGPVLTSAQESRVESKVVLQNSDVYVERGFHQPYGVVLVLLVLVGGLVVLVAAVMATGLAMSEARPDLSTLAAIGARPRTRRVIAAAQSLVVGLVGTLLGVALGFVPGLAVTWPLTVTNYGGPTSSVGGVDASVSTGPVIAIPWTVLLVVVIAVPLIAALASGLFTRSRLPMVRRLAT
jgi:putative ABC transport system permease protein